MKKITINENIIPPEIVKIIPEGVFCVGGCVRDTILGRTVNDVDLCTPLLPAKIVERSEDAGFKTISTGIYYGTVIVITSKASLEITTFRNESNHDGRYAEVEFVDNLTKDLSRRDFTINAIAADSNGYIYDPFNGREDIQQKTIRCVGIPTDRFKEDLLRIIRAARFAAQLDFTIEKNTMDAMKEVAPTLIDEIFERISIERIVKETEKAFKTTKPSRYLQILWDLNIIQTIIPEMKNMDALQQNPKYHPEGSVWQHTLEAVDRADQSVRWHVLLHDIGKCFTADPVEGKSYNTFYKHEIIGAKFIDDIGKRLKLSNDLTKSIEVVTRLHMRPFAICRSIKTKPSNKSVRRLLYEAGLYKDALEKTIRADSGSRYSPNWDIFWNSEISINDIIPILMGRHLIERGHQPGKEIGKILNFAYNYQIDSGETSIKKLYEKAILEYNNES